MPERAHLAASLRLLLQVTDEGLLVMTRQQALARLRSDVAGADLVGELLAGRRRDAADE